MTPLFSLEQLDWMIRPHFMRYETQRRNMIVQEEKDFSFGPTEFGVPGDAKLAFGRNDFRI